MRIAITGATGLLGGALTRSLEADGHAVTPVTRRTGEGPSAVRWNIPRGEIERDKLEGHDAVVHYAGEPIGDHRWTDAQKRRIRQSRVDGTRLLAETLASLDSPPAVLVSGSGAGYYGDRGDEVLTEEASPGHDFLADLCVAWEAATTAAEQAGVRVVTARNGVVIARGGDLLERCRLPFKLGVGGRIGNGRQWVPWVALADQVRAVRFVIDSDLVGPVNVTAPEPVTNAETTKALGAAMHRPAILPVPPLAVRIVYGEMGVSLATVSQRAVPLKLLDAGFEFRVTDLRAALEDALAT